MGIHHGGEELGEQRRRKNEEVGACKASLMLGSWERGFTTRVNPFSLLVLNYLFFKLVIE